MTASASGAIRTARPCSSRPERSTQRRNCRRPTGAPAHRASSLARPGGHDAPGRPSASIGLGEAIGPTALYYNQTWPTVSPPAPLDVVGLPRSQQAPWLRSPSGHACGDVTQGLARPVYDPSRTTVQHGPHRSSCHASDGRQGLSKGPRIAGADKEKDMSMMAVTFPILPGKTPQWRRWMQDLNGPRREDFAASRSRVGVHERTFLQQLPMGDFVIVTLEGEDPGHGFEQMMSASEPIHDLVPGQGPGDARGRSERPDERPTVRACHRHGACPGSSPVAGASSPQPATTRLLVTTSGLVSCPDGQPEPEDRSAASTSLVAIWPR